MTDPTLNCPQCGTEIKLTESLAGPLLERTRVEYEVKLKAKDVALAEQHQKLKQEQEQIEKDRQALGTQIEQGIEKERRKIALEESEKAKKFSALEVERKDQEANELKNILLDRENKLAASQKKQAELFGVKCHLNYEVSAEDINVFNPDVVILATGSLPALPSVEGIEKDIVLTYEDVLNDEPVDFQSVVIVGGGPTGLELALYLSECRCSVTVVEILSDAGKDLEAMTKKIILARLKENNVAVATDTRLLRIEDNGVIVADRENQERFIESDKVLIAIGTRPNIKLYDQIKSLGFKIHQIGDCLEPRSAKDAIYESAVLGRKI